MKVGILTFHFSDNYGALFQASALKYWFEKNECNVEFINYHPRYIEDGGKLDYLKPFSISNLKVFYLLVSGFYNSIVTPGKYDDGMKEFRSSFLNVGSDFYDEYSDLTQEFSKYDLVVCGSDQIWNPSVQYGVDSNYFLKVNAPVSAKRISYAASFGSSQLDDKHLEKIGQLVSGLDAVSVREDVGADIVEKITEYRPVVVPDPTILNSDFSSFYRKPDFLNDVDDYAFLYYLRSNLGVSEVCAQVIKKYDIPIYEVHNPHRRWRCSGKVVYPTPGEWLYGLKNAKLVITNSFHGVALSVTHNKNFVYIALRGSREKMNSRAFNLLKAVGLESRIVRSDDEIDRVLSAEIDWGSVNEKISLLRSKGEDYLFKQMDSVRS